jgi:hypothetical protein
VGGTKERELGMTDEFDYDPPQRTFDEELDAFAGDADGPKGVDAPVVGAAAAPAGVLGSEFTLEDLAKPGSRFEELAKELIVARDERAGRAAAAALDRIVDAGLEAGEIDLTNPMIREGLAAQVQASRDEASAAYLAARASEYGKVYGPETVAEMMANERAALAAAAAFESPERLWEQHPAFVDAARRDVELSRALELSRDRVANMSPDFGLADIEAEIAATFRGAVESAT